MKKLLLTFVFAIACANLFAQPAAKPLPFIIQGQISNCPEKQLFLIFKEDGKYKIDTIPLDNNGRFYLKTFKVTEPNSAQFANNTNSLTQLYIAPGYNLTLEADGKDGQAFSHNREISGIGSTVNNYSDLIFKSYVAWWTLNEKDLLAFVKKYMHLSDSAFHVYFDKKILNDKYFDYFKRSMQLNIVFSKLFYLTAHVDDSISYSYDKSVNFIRENFGNDTILSNLFKEEYLASEEYRNLMMNEYPAYLRNLTCRKDPAMCDKKEYWVQIAKQVSTNYKGKVKNMTLFRIMERSIRNCRSFEELNTYKTGFPKYITELNDKNQQEELQNSLISKGDELAKAQIGRPAPLFTAADSLGKSYNITDYKGKVVYLDLWASWCGPCRAETPYFKTLYEKYKNDDRIVFMSVAVMDKPEDWRKALRQDKPSWLQLFDTDGKVQSSYVANSIPKFILINKQANIVSFDAPSPYDAAKLEKMLQAEIEK